jgi:hypothetical protein
MIGSFVKDKVPAFRRLFPRPVDLPLCRRAGVSVEGKWSVDVPSMLAADCEVVRLTSEVISGVSVVDSPIFGCS